MTRWVFAADNHGDKIDPAVEKQFFEFLGDFKPTIRIHGGDLVDLRPLRRKAGAAERAEGVKGDIGAGVAFFKRYMPTVWTWGNHEDRLRETAEKDDGVLAEAAADGMTKFEELAKSIDCAVVPYDKRKFFELGNYKVLHGFAHGIYAVRKHAQIYGPCIHGHIHAFGAAPIETVNDAGVLAWSSGCLRYVDADYNSRHLAAMRQENGWLYGIVTKSGRVEIFPCRSATSYWTPYEKTGQNKNN